MEREKEKRREKISFSLHTLFFASTLAPRLKSTETISVSYTHFSGVESTCDLASRIRFRVDASRLADLGALMHQLTVKKEREVSSWSYKTVNH